MMLSKYPIIKVLFPYIAGIFLASIFPLLPLKYLKYFILLFIVLVVSFLVLCRIFNAPRRAVTLPFTFSFFLFGFLLTNVKNFTVHFFDHQKNAQFGGKMVAHIMAPPIKKEKTIQVFAKIHHSDIGKNTPTALLTFPKDSLSLSLSKNDWLLVDATLSPPRPPQNPDVFDYRSYLQRRGVSLTAFVQPHEWVLLEHPNRPSVSAAAARLQSVFSDLFAANGLSGPEYSVITAILLGNNETMDADLKAGYSAAGVSHILCVSGMHVGIIFMILNFLLKPLDYSIRLRFVKSLLLVLAVWFYAALTGLAPSVQRSATMFTFMTVGGLLRRPVDVFHSLFASMFFLLLINPLLIFEIGFEMSYLAVFGIVIFQPRLSALLSPKTRIGRYFWELVCVSVAAQLSTFPLSVYYFGQFPNYFLLSNLSVMSLSFVVIVTGVVLLVVSWCPAVAGGVGWLLTREIRMMNGIISFINTLPYSVTDHLSFTLLQTLLIYGIITTAFLFFVKKIKMLKYCSLILTIVLLVTFTFAKFQRLSNREITFYSINKCTVVGVNRGGEGVLFLDSAAMASSDWYDFHVKNHEWKQVVQNQFVSIDSNFVSQFIYLQNHFLCFEGKTIYFLSKRTWLYPESVPLHVDFLFVQDNAKIPLSRLLKTFEIEEVIIGNNVTPYYQKRWTDSCLAREIPVHSLRENGYLTIQSDI